MMTHWYPRLRRLYNGVAFSIQFCLIISELSGENLDGTLCQE
jgi:hypothetical protein